MIVKRHPDGSVQRELRTTQLTSLMIACIMGRDDIVNLLLDVKEWKPQKARTVLTFFMNTKNHDSDFVLILLSHVFFCQHFARAYFHINI